MKNKCIMRLTAFLTAAAILFAPAAGTGVFAAESAEREAAKEQDVQDPAQEAADGQEARDPAPETVIEENAGDSAQEEAEEQKERERFIKSS